MKKWCSKDNCVSFPEIRAFINRMQQTGGAKHISYLQNLSQLSSKLKLIDSQVFAKANTIKPERLKSSVPISLKPASKPSSFKGWKTRI